MVNLDIMYIVMLMIMLTSTTVSGLQIMNITIVKFIERHGLHFDPMTTTFFVTGKMLFLCIYQMVHNIFMRN